MDLSELPQPNIPLLRKAVEWAEAEAAKTDGTCAWNQAYWAQQTQCGTAYCIAGYVVSAAVPGASTRLARHGRDLELLVGGELADWFDVGQDALQVGDDEAEQLFFWNNSIQRVRTVAEQIAARAGERL